MKKFKLLQLFVAFFATLSFTSCDDTIFKSTIFTSKEWDISPVDVNIYLFDKNGNNLLENSFSGNLIEAPISINYKDKEYKLGEQVEISRAYMPQFSGLQLLEKTSYYDAHMQFGEFEGAESYTMSMTLNICNNESYEIKVVRDFRWDFKGDPDGKTTYYLDGKKIDGRDIFITTNNSYASLEWDYAPVVISMAVVDTKGNNLLDLETEGNILGEEISIDYNGKSYDLGDGGKLVATRDIPAIFTGLTIDQNMLHFGEFEGNQDYDMTLKLNIGNDKSYTMHYVRDFEHPDPSKQPIVEEERYLDDAVVEGRIFTITK